MADQNDGHPLSESNFVDQLFKRIRKIINVFDVGIANLHMAQVNFKAVTLNVNNYK